MQAAKILISTNG